MHVLATRFILSGLVVCAALLASIAPASAQTTRVVVDEHDVSTFVTDVRASLHIPSIALGIVGPERVHYLEIYGEAERDEPFLIGSLSKSVTALAVMLLVHDEKLSLDDEASKWVEGVPSGVTVRHLLHQRSGLDRADGGSGWTDVDATIEALAQRASWERPGGEFSYANLNYHILGAIVERVSGQPYGQFVKNHIFDPLGMKHASAGPTPPEGHVTGHQYLFGFAAPLGEPSYNPAVVPGGFVWMSSEDMVRWIQTFVGGGVLDGERVIPAEVVATLLEAPEDQPYAMGWTIASREGVKVARHTGLTGAFSASMAVVPEREFGVFVLTNINSWMGLAPRDVVRGVVGSMLGLSVEPTSNMEFVLRLGFGIIVALMLLSFLFQLFRWLGAGLPLGLGRKELIAVVIVFAINGALFVFVPSYFEIPVRVMIAIQPDIGGGFVALVVLGSLRQLLKGFNQTRLRKGIALEES